MPPTIVRTIADARRAIASGRAGKKTIGLVPTMGALHEGHISLIHAARAETEFVAVSIFVNPTQFGPKEDFARYPRPFEKDVVICAQNGVDLIFHPTAEEIYPAGYRTYVEVHELQDVLCGKSRPGHFRGVATVVLKLFNILQPDKAYFGQKDGQQVRIIQKMVEDLNVPVEIRVCPTVREPDGLALSSRNQYLDTEERKRAPEVFRALQQAESLIQAGERDAHTLVARVTDHLQKVPGLRIDYVAVVDQRSLMPVERLAGSILIAVAVFFGTTRLIDNLPIEISG